MLLPLRYTLAAAVLAGVLLGAVPTATAYSCAITPGSALSGDRPAFTGRVVDRDGDQILIQVDEVWSGGPVEAEVWVTSEMLVGDSRPRAPGPEPWLYAPYEAPGGEPSVNQCNSWPLTPLLVAEIRPSTVTYPVSATRPRDAPAPEAEVDTGPGTGIIAGIGTGAVLVVAGAAIAWRRRRTD